MSLAGKDQDDLRFEYKGKDLAVMSAEDALSEDWTVVASYISVGIPSEGE
jgi:hypothetical protein